MNTDNTIDAYNEYIKKQIEIDDATENEPESFFYSVSSYGADYSAEVLVSKLKKDQIFIPPFQRKYVWNIQKASRFIESLLLGLPVPGIFLSLEASTNKLLIVDGQQRLMSLFKFYDGRFDENKVFKLKGVSKDFDGKTYNELKESDRFRLDDSTLHATVIKQDKPTDDDSSIYMVFERLNTGGMPLQAQEIRACIYYGHFNDLLSELTQLPIWRSLFSKENPRMKEQELILRYFTFLYESENYKKGFKAFMNSFMSRNRKLELHSEDELRNKFIMSLDLLVNTIGKNVFRRGKKLNAAIFDSVMIGVTRRMDECREINRERLKNQYHLLLNDDEYLSFVEKSTSGEKSVKGRIGMATRYFREV